MAQTNLDAITKSDGNFITDINKFIYDQRDDDEVLLYLLRTVRLLLTNRVADNIYFREIISVCRDKAHIVQILEDDPEFEGSSNRSMGQ